jgi:hypothetical protein
MVWVFSPNPFNSISLLNFTTNSITNTIPDGDKNVSVNAIFKAHWDGFLVRHSSKLRQVEVDEVTKMLSCKGQERGSKVYYCKECDEYHFVYFGCNSRICSLCGKRHTDHWSDNLSKNTFDVPHKHFTMTLPDMLWNCIREDRSALKVLMDSAIQTITEFYENIFGKDITPGCIVVLHQFGRDIKYNPHIHVLATQGGFDKNRIFQVWTQFVPFKKLHKKWMAIVCKNLKAHFPNTDEFTQLFRIIWALYRDTGFVVDVCKRTIKNKKELAKYIARYIRHPAIANSRLVSFDNKQVHFYYFSHKTHKRVDVFMPIDEFIIGIIQHIPEKQFKTIRYYGAYCRNQKREYTSYLKSSIQQTKLTSFGSKREVMCPKCNKPMIFIWYFEKKPPPDKLMHPPNTLTLLDFV